MKKIVFLAVAFFSLICFKPADAQLSVGLSLNIGSQPTWGPVGYDRVDYYYLPDIDCYYDVPAHQFIYLSGGRWIRSGYLPPRYRGYDLYSGYKVVVNHPHPYLQHNIYRSRYAAYRGRRGQSIIRDSHDARYRRPMPGHRPGYNRPMPGHRPGFNRPMPGHRPGGNRPMPGHRPGGNRPIPGHRPGGDNRPSPGQRPGGGNRPGHGGGDHRPGGNRPSPGHGPGGGGNRPGPGHGGGDHRPGGHH